MQFEREILETVPFLWVTDIKQSVIFYEQGLGFTRTKSWESDGLLRWCRLEAGRGTLMLQEFWREGRNRNLPAEKLGVGLSLTFVCVDALAIYRLAISRGLHASRPFVGNGMWVTSLVDPDGYRLEFESATDVVEGTVWAGE